MNNGTEKVAKNNRFFDKRVLATAVAAAMYGSTGIVLAAATDIGVDTSVTGGTAASATNYNIGNSYTLTIKGGATPTAFNSSFNGTINGNKTALKGGLDGNIVIAGNLTMRGNIGSTNMTGNMTVNTGNTLVLEDSMTTVNVGNITIGAHSSLNFGNTTKGYNRDTVLTLTSNITMASNSTINLGNNVTLSGDIVGLKSGAGTINIVGNFTSGGHFGDAAQDNQAMKLEQINISKGNTFTIGNTHNATSTRMNINGTVTAYGAANITSAITMGTGSVLNLTNLGGTGLVAARVTGAIEGLGGSYGTVNVNGTWTTAGKIGNTTSGISVLNLSSGANSAALTSTFAHNVNATTINLGKSTAQGNATLNITGSITVGGDIVSSGNASAAGIIDIDENTIFTDNIGTSTAAIETIKILGIKTATFKDSIYSGNITLQTATSGSGINATFAFNGTANTAYTVTGGIDGDVNGQGKIVVNSGNVTFSSVIGGTFDIGGIVVKDDAEMKISNNISLNNTISVVGTLDINTSAVTLHTAGINIGENAETGSTLETSRTITLTSDTTATAGGGANMAFNNATIRLNGTHSGHATSATAYIDIGTNNQTVTIQGNTTIDVDLRNSVITDGATIVIIGRGDSLGSNGTLNVSGNVSATAYKMFSITINNSTAFSAGYGNHINTASLNATVDYRSSSSLGFTGNDKTVYDGSKVAIAADTAVFQALAALTTDAQIKAAITTMSPATGGSAAASAAISGSSVTTVNTRMAYLRQTGLGKGMNAGSAAKDESLWLQIFGASIDQDTVGSVSGYDADGQGIAIGIDGMSADGTTRIGVAGSFANTDVDGKDSTTKTTSDIDTTQVMVYANKDYGDGMYLQGVASYSFNDNTGTRRILVGSVDRTASSSYDSGLFSIGVEAGWPKEDDGVTITPTVGLTFSSLDSDTYTETGAGNMNLKVTPVDVNIFEGKLGVKMTGKTVDADGGVGRPEVRIGVSHNFGDETADSTATFTAGGAAFTTTGVKTDSTKVDVGLGYTYTTPEGDTEISVNLDGRHSSSYVQYGSGLTVKWKF